MPNFSIPLSGLTAMSTALSTISNNLANLNTTGYKDTTVNFRDMFYQSLGTNGAGDQLQIGAGASVASINTNFSGGSTQSTGVNTDIAITGNGLFVVQNGSNTNYTRAGNFTRNSAGYLVTADGYQVQGYPATNGVVNANGGLGAIQLQDSMINPPNATSTISVPVNLSADAPVNGTYNTSITVYDSLGTSHVLGIAFTRLNATEWNYKVTLPRSEVTAGGTGTTTLLDSSVPAPGTPFSFDTSGNLTGATTPIIINIPSLADGAKAPTLTWNLADSSGKGLITQVSGDSSALSTNQDGYRAGTLTDFSINADGTIVGAFTNGTKILGQVALANFANLEGLTKQGSNNYAATMSSGSAVIGPPGTGSLGVLTGKSLELSNVDMSQEFSSLIIAQRGFQANAKSVTTFDQIAQDTISMIR